VVATTTALLVGTAATPAVAEADLTADVRPFINAAVAGQGTLTGVSVNLGWGLALGFTGAAGGNIIMNVTVPRITVSASVHKSGFGDAYMTAAVGPLPVQATYNIFTGVVDNIQVMVSPVPVATSVEIDGEWWVDILDFFTFGQLTEYIEDVFNDELYSQLKGSIATFLAAKAATSGTRSPGGSSDP